MGQNIELTKVPGILHCYDCVGYAGVSNDFLVNTKNETALIYNDVSVNENMHLATAFKILRRPGNNLMEHLSAEQYRFFRRTVIQIVLATDMAGHAELLQASGLPPAFSQASSPARGSIHSNSTSDHACWPSLCYTLMHDIQGLRDTI